IVPAGSSIAPSAPGGTGIGPGQDPLPEITTTERTHLFLIDLHPQTFFSHPVKYALVGESGRTQVVEASWLPAVDGIVPPELKEDEPDPGLLVAGNWANHLGIGTVSSWTLSPWLDLAPSEGYIVVQGLMPDENLYGDARATGLEGRAFFEAYASPNGRVDLLEEGDADTVLAVMSHMASEGRSPIVVSIIAHGSIDSVRLGGQLVTAQHLVQRVRMHPDHTFSFLIGSCHSGSFVDDLRLEPNVRVVATAVGPNEGAVPDWDTSPLFDDENPADTGSEWFSSYYRAAADIVSNAQRMSIVNELAGLFGVGQTEMLLCQTVYAAIGYNPLLLPDRIDFDFSHALGLEAPVTYGTRTPVRYCSWF
ncbi:MAG: hypothetical protein H5U40_03005, partial [Polyangiaceae bacterium]|nr:hypothetical protein [Polyangiaceae bacterium]